ncbi:MAG: hypothetical protein ACR2HR_05065 [Euzebya sp.]
MDHTPRSERVQRTVTVVVQYAVDVDHAVEVLVAEFGFDQTFLALAQVTDNPAVHRAMWTALSVHVNGYSQLAGTDDPGQTPRH